MPRLIRTALAATALLSSAPAWAEEIWVTNEKDNTISVIDTATLEVTRTIPTGERPRGITFSKDYSKVYICASDSDTVQVMDPESGEILHNLPSGEDPEQFVLAPDDRHLYIANENDAVTTVVDTETRTVVAQIDVGIEPEGMAISPTARSPSPPPKPPTWRTGSTPRPTSFSPTRWSTAARATRNSPRTAPSSG